jgi:hypothetical protein
MIYVGFIFSTPSTTVTNDARIRGGQSHDPGMSGGSWVTGGRLVQKDSVLVTRG